VSLELALRALAAAGAALVLAAPAAAQPAPGPATRGTATRAVVAYSALEARLADLVANADRAGLEALVAEDFVYLAPGTTDPLDRAAYLDAELARPAAAGRFYALAVVERGDLDLVSFLVRFERQAGARRTFETAYVVDAWRRADQRLVSRHRSVPRRAPPPPTAATGRE
jgi:hypothetical protein